MKGKNKTSFSIKLIASLTLVCFVYTGVIFQPLYGMVENHRDVSKLENVMDAFVIPFNNGRITEALYFDNEKIIINIQDLHCHSEAQENIAQILSILDKKYGLQQVFIEGATGSVDTSWVEEIGNEKTKNELIKTLLDSGRLTGAEYYSINSKRYNLLQGLEYEKMYNENIIRLSEILIRRNNIQTLLPKIKTAINHLSKKYYTKNNKKLKKLTNKYNAEKINAYKYFRSLINLANKNQISLHNYENIKQYVDLDKLQKSLKYKKLNKELTLFVKRLKSRIPYNAYKLLLDKTDNFARLNEFYLYLSEISKKYNLNLNVEFRELSKFLKFVQKNQKINSIELVKEEKKLLRELHSRLSGSIAEREIAFLVNFFDCIEQYFTNKLSADDYRYFTRNIDSFKLLWGKYITTVTRISDLGSRTSHESLATSHGLYDLEPYYGLFSNFYETNIERNKYFLQNVLRDYKEVPIPKVRLIPDVDHYSKSIQALNQSKEVIVMITGGFHSKGISNILKNQKITHIVITPNVCENTKLAEEVYTKLAKYQAKRIASESIAVAVLSDLLETGTPNQRFLKILAELGFSNLPINEDSLVDFIITQLENALKNPEVTPEIIVSQINAAYSARNINASVRYGENTFVFNFNSNKPQRFINNKGRIAYQRNNDSGNDGKSYLAVSLDAIQNVILNYSGPKLALRVFEALQNTDIKENIDPSFKTKNEDFKRNVLNNDDIKKLLRKRLGIRREVDLADKVIVRTIEQNVIKTSDKKGLSLIRSRTEGKGADKVLIIELASGYWRERGKYSDVDIVVTSHELSEGISGKPWQVYHRENSDDPAIDFVEDSIFKIICEAINEFRDKEGSIESIAQLIALEIINKVNPIKKKLQARPVPVIAEDVIAGDTTEAYLLERRPTGWLEKLSRSRTTAIPRIRRLLSRNPDDKPHLDRFNELLIISKSAVIKHRIIPELTKLVAHSKSFNTVLALLNNYLTNLDEVKKGINVPEIFKLTETIIEYGSLESKMSLTGLDPHLYADIRYIIELAQYSTRSGNEKIDQVIELQSTIPVESLLIWGQRATKGDVITQSIDIAERTIPMKIISDSKIAPLPKGLDSYCFVDRTDSTVVVLQKELPDEMKIEAITQALRVAEKRLPEYKVEVKRLEELISKILGYSVRVVHNINPGTINFLKILKSSDDSLIARITYKLLDKDNDDLRQYLGYSSPTPILYVTNWRVMNRDDRKRGIMRLMLGFVAINHDMTRLKVPTPNDDGPAFLRRLNEKSYIENLQTERRARTSLINLSKFNELFDGSSNVNALKDVGRGNYARVHVSVTEKWKQMAEGIENKPYDIGGEPRYAKVIEDSDNAPLPQGDHACHFFDEEGSIVIVLKRGLSENIKNEAIYHEFKEADWKYKLEPVVPKAQNRAEIAHIISCAEEVLEFGRGDLTPFHKSQLKNLKNARSIDKLMKLKKEYEEEEYQKGRKRHYSIIGQHLGKEKLSQIKDYERKFYQTVNRYIFSLDLKELLAKKISAILGYSIDIKYYEGSSLAVVSRLNGNVIAHISYNTRNNKTGRIIDSTDTDVTPVVNIKNWQVFNENDRQKGIMRLMFGYLALMHNTEHFTVLAPKRDAKLFLNKLKARGYIKYLDMTETDKRPAIAKANLDKFARLFDEDDKSDPDQETLTPYATTRWLEGGTLWMPTWLRALLAAPIVEEIMYRITIPSAILLVEMLVSYLLGIDILKNILSLIIIAQIPSAALFIKHHDHDRRRSAFIVSIVNILTILLGFTIIQWYIIPAILLNHSLLNLFFGHAEFIVRTKKEKMPDYVVIDSDVLPENDFLSIEMLDRNSGKTVKSRAKILKHDETIINKTRKSIIEHIPMQDRRDILSSILSLLPDDIPLLLLENIDAPITGFAIHKSNNSKYPKGFMAIHKDLVENRVALYEVILDYLIKSKRIKVRIIKRWPNVFYRFGLAKAYLEFTDREGKHIYFEYIDRFYLDYILRIRNDKLPAVLDIIRLSTHISVEYHRLRSINKLRYFLDSERYGLFEKMLLRGHYFDKHSTFNSEYIQAGYRELLKNSPQYIYKSIEALKFARYERTKILIARNIKEVLSNEEVSNKLNFSVNNADTLLESMKQIRDFKLPTKELEYSRKQFAECLALFAIGNAGIIDFLIEKMNGEKDKNMLGYLSYAISAGLSKNKDKKLNYDQFKILIKNARSIARKSKDCARHNFSHLSVLANAIANNTDLKPHFVDVFLSEKNMTIKWELLSIFKNIMMGNQDFVLTQNEIAVIESMSSTPISVIYCTLVLAKERIDDGKTAVEKLKKILDLTSEFEKEFPGSYMFEYTDQQKALLMALKELIMNNSKPQDDKLFDYIIEVIVNPDTSEVIRKQLLMALDAVLDKNQNIKLSSDNLMKLITRAKSFRNVETKTLESVIKFASRNNPVLSDSILEKLVTATEDLEEYMCSTALMETIKEDSAVIEKYLDEIQNKLNRGEDFISLKEDSLIKCLRRIFENKPHLIWTITESLKQRKNEELKSLLRNALNERISKFYPSQVIPSLTGIMDYYWPQIGNYWEFFLNKRNKFRTPKSLYPIIIGLIPHEFICEESNDAMLEAKLKIVETIGYISNDEQSEIISYVLEKINGQTHDKALAYVRGLGNMLSCEAITTESSLDEWQLLIENYVNDFSGFLASKDLFTAYKLLHKGVPLSDERIREFELDKLNVTETGSKGVEQLKAVIIPIRNKIFEEYDIDDKYLNNPIVSALVGSLIGFYTATFGHGSSRNLDLEKFVTNFHRRQKRIPPIDKRLKNVKKGKFKVRKKGTIDFNPTEYGVFIKFKEIIEKASAMCNLGNALEEIKNKVSKCLNDEISTIPEGQEKYSKDLQNLVKMVNRSRSIVDILVLIIDNYDGKKLKKNKKLQDIIKIALVSETFVQYPHEREKIVPYLEEGLSTRFIDKILALKSVFLKDHILAEVEKAKRKKILQIFNISTFENASERRGLLDETETVKAFVTKGVLGEMAGDIGDACYTAIDNLMGYKNMVCSVLFTNGEGIEKRFVGSLLILENTIEGEKTWIIRALNPSLEFIEDQSDEDFINGMLAYVEKLALAAGVKNIVAPIGQPGALSNRPTIKSEMKKFVKGDFVKLDNPESLNHYDLMKNACKIVSRPKKVMDFANLGLNIDGESFSKFVTKEKTFRSAYENEWNPDKLYDFLKELISKQIIPSNIKIKLVSDNKSSYSVTHDKTINTLFINLANDKLTPVNGMEVIKKLLNTHSINEENNPVGTTKWLESRTLWMPKWLRILIVAPVVEEIIYRLIIPLTAAYLLTIPFHFFSFGPYVIDNYFIIFYIIGQLFSFGKFADHHHLKRRRLASFISLFNLPLTIFFGYFPAILLNILVHSLMSLISGQSGVFDPDSKNRETDYTITGVEKTPNENRLKIRAQNKKTGEQKAYDSNIESRGPPITESIASWFELQETNEFISNLSKLDLPAVCYVDKIEGGIPGFIHITDNPTPNNPNIIGIHKSLEQFPSIQFELIMEYLIKTGKIQLKLEKPDIKPWQLISYFTKPSVIKIFDENNNELWSTNIYGISKIKAALKPENMLNLLDILVNQDRQSKNARFVARIRYLLANKHFKALERLLVDYYVNYILRVSMEMLDVFPAVISADKAMIANVAEFIPIVKNESVRELMLGQLTEVIKTNEYKLAPEQLVPILRIYKNIALSSEFKDHSLGSYFMPLFDAAIENNVELIDTFIDAIKKEDNQHMLLKLCRVLDIGLAKHNKKKLSHEQFQILLNSLRKSEIDYSDYNYSVFSDILGQALASNPSLLRQLWGEIFYQTDHGKKAMLANALCKAMVINKDLELDDHQIERLISEAKNGVGENKYELYDYEAIINAAALAVSGKSYKKSPIGKLSIAIMLLKEFKNNHFSLLKYTGNRSYSFSDRYFVVSITRIIELNLAEDSNALMNYLGSELNDKRSSCDIDLTLATSLQKAIEDNKNIVISIDIFNNLIDLYLRVTNTSISVLSDLVVNAVRNHTPLANTALERLLKTKDLRESSILGRCIAASGNSMEEILSVLIDNIEEKLKNNENPAILLNALKVIVNIQPDSLKTITSILQKKDNPELKEKIRIMFEDIISTVKPETTIPMFAPYISYYWPALGQYSQKLLAIAARISTAARAHIIFTGQFPADFICNEDNMTMLSERLRLMDNLTRTNKYSRKEIIAYVISKIEEKNHDEILDYVRSINNLFRNNCIDKSTSLEQIQLILEHYVADFGFIVNRKLIEFYSFLYHNGSLEFSMNRERFKPEALGITETGRPGIEQLKKAIIKVKKDLFENNDLDEKVLDHPIVEALAGGILGFSTATHGHGSSRGMQLKPFVRDFHIANKTNPPIDERLTAVKKASFKVRKKGSIDFTPTEYGIYEKFRKLIEKASELCKEKDPSEVIRQKILESLNSEYSKTHQRNEVHRNKLSELIEKIKKTKSIVEMLVTIAKILDNKKISKDLQEIIKLALVVETFIEYPNEQEKIVPFLDEGLSPEFLDQIMALKYSFLKDHVLGKVEIPLRKKLLQVFKITTFEEAAKRRGVLSDTVKVNAFVTKGLLGEMAGDIGDACYTGVNNLMGYPSLVCSVIFTKGKGIEKEFVGSMLILETTIHGQKTWILRGINPSLDFISHQSDEDFLDGTLDYVEKLAAAVGVTKIVAPMGSIGALSNRPSINSTMKRYVGGLFLNLDKEESLNRYHLKKGVCKAVIKPKKIKDFVGLGLNIDAESFSRFIRKEKTFRDAYENGWNAEKLYELLIKLINDGTLSSDTEVKLVCEEGNPEPVDYDESKKALTLNLANDKLTPVNGINLIKSLIPDHKQWTDENPDQDPTDTKNPQMVGAWLRGAFRVFPRLTAWIFAPGKESAFLLLFSYLALFFGSPPLITTLLAMTFLIVQALILSFGMHQKAIIVLTQKDLEEQSELIKVNKFFYGKDQAEVKATKNGIKYIEVDTDLREKLSIFQHFMLMGILSVTFMAFIFHYSPFISFISGFAISFIYHSTLNIKNWLTGEFLLVGYGSISNQAMDEFRKQSLPNYAKLGWDRYIVMDSEFVALEKPQYEKAFIDSLLTIIKDKRKAIPEWLARRRGLKKVDTGTNDNSEKTITPYEEEVIKQIMAFLDSIKKPSSSISEALQFINRNGIEAEYWDVEYSRFIVITFGGIKFLYDPYAHKNDPHASFALIPIDEVARKLRNYDETTVFESDEGQATTSEDPNLILFRYSWKNRTIKICTNYGTGYYCATDEYGRLYDIWEDVPSEARYLGPGKHRLIDLSSGMKETLKYFPAFGISPQFIDYLADSEHDYEMLADVLWNTDSYRPEVITETELPDNYDQAEKIIILTSFWVHKGSFKKALKSLGITRKTLKRKMEKYKITKEGLVEGEGPPHIICDRIIELKTLKDYLKQRKRRKILNAILEAEKTDLTDEEVSTFLSVIRKRERDLNEMPLERYMNKVLRSVWNAFNASSVRVTESLNISLKYLMDKISLIANWGVIGSKKFRMWLWRDWNDLEREHILRILINNKADLEKSADILEIEPEELTKKIQKHKINIDHIKILSNKKSVALGNSILEATLFIENNIAYEEAKKRMVFTALWRSRTKEHASALLGITGEDLEKLVKLYGIKSSHYSFNDKPEIPIFSHIVTLGELKAIIERRDKQQKETAQWADEDPEIPKPGLGMGKTQMNVFPAGGALAVSLALIKVSPILAVVFVLVGLASVLCMGSGGIRRNPRRKGLRKKFNTTSFQHKTTKQVRLTSYEFNLDDIHNIMNKYNNHGFLIKLEGSEFSLSELAMLSLPTRRKELIAKLKSDIDSNLSKLRVIKNISDVLRGVSDHRLKMETEYETIDSQGPIKEKGELSPEMLILLINQAQFHWFNHHLDLSIGKPGSGSLLNARFVELENGERVKVKDYDTQLSRLEKIVINNTVSPFKMSLGGEISYNPEFSDPTIRKEIIVGRIDSEDGELRPGINDVLESVVAKMLSEGTDLNHLIRAFRNSRNMLFLLSDIKAAAVHQICEFQYSNLNELIEESLKNAIAGRPIGDRQAKINEYLRKPASELSTYEKRIVDIQGTPQRIIFRDTATEKELRDPDIMIIERAIMPEKSRRNIPEKIFIATWKKQVFFLYISRTHTTKVWDNTDAAVHQWRIGGGVYFGGWIAKNTPEHIDECSTEMCLDLDKALYEHEKRMGGEDKAYESYKLFVEDKKEDQNGRFWLNEALRISHNNPYLDKDFRLKNEMRNIPEKPKRAKLTTPSRATKRTVLTPINIINTAINANGLHFEKEDAGTVAKFVVPNRSIIRKFVAELYYEILILGNKDLRQKIASRYTNFSFKNSKTGKSKNARICIIGTKPGYIEVSVDIYSEEKELWESINISIEVNETLIEMALKKLRAEEPGNKDHIDDRPSGPDSGPLQNIFQPVHERIKKNLDRLARDVLVSEKKSNNWNEATDTQKNAIVKSNFKFFIYVIGYYLTHPLLNAPAWETIVFQYLGMATIGWWWATIVFSFAHILTKWIVKAHRIKNLYKNKKISFWVTFISVVYKNILTDFGQFLFRTAVSFLFITPYFFIDSIFWASSSVFMIHFLWNSFFTLLLHFYPKAKWPNWFMMDITQESGSESNISAVALEESRKIAQSIAESGILSPRQIMLHGVRLVAPSDVEYSHKKQIPESIRKNGVHRNDNSTAYLFPGALYLALIASGESIPEIVLMLLAGFAIIGSVYGLCALLLGLLNRNMPDVFPVFKDFSSETDDYPEILIENDGKIDGIVHKCIIIDRPLTKEFMYDIADDTPDDVKTIVWTVEELKRLRFFQPFEFDKVEKIVGKDRIESICGRDLYILDNSEYKLKALMRALGNAIGPCDMRIIHSNRNNMLDRTRNKYEQYKSLRNCMIEMRLIKEEDDTLLSDNLEGTREEFIRIKLKLLEYVAKLPVQMDFEEVGTDTNMAKEDKFGYIEEIRELLGDNLKAIVAYGSSVYSKGSEEYGDYDNWVIVENIEKAYEVFRNKGDFTLEHNGHHVHINLIPVAIASKYITCNLNPSVRRCDMKVLYGKVKLPVYFSRDIEDLGWIHIYDMIARIRLRAFSEIYSDPDFIIAAYDENRDEDQKLSLYKYFAEQLYIFTIRTYLNHLNTENDRPMLKREIKSLLQRLGFLIPEFSRDPDYIIDSIFETIANSSRLLDMVLPDVTFFGLKHNRTLPVEDTQKTKSKIDIDLFLEFLAKHSYEFTTYHNVPLQGAITFVKSIRPDVEVPINAIAPGLHKADHISAVSALDETSYERVKTIANTGMRVTCIAPPSKLVPISEMTEVTSSKVSFKIDNHDIYLKVYAREMPIDYKNGGKLTVLSYSYEGEYGDIILPSDINEEKLRDLAPAHITRWIAGDPNVQKEIGYSNRTFGLDIFETDTPSPEVANLLRTDIEFMRTVSVLNMPYQDAVTSENDEYTESNTSTDLFDVTVTGRDSLTDFNNIENMLKQKQSVEYMRGEPILSVTFDTDSESLTIDTLAERLASNEFIKDYENKADTFVLRGIPEKISRSLSLKIENLSKVLHDKGIRLIPEIQITSESFRQFEPQIIHLMRLGASGIRFDLRKLPNNTDVNRLNNWLAGIKTQIVGLNNNALIALIPNYLLDIREKFFDNNTKEVVLLSPEEILANPNLINELSGRKNIWLDICEKQIIDGKDIVCEIPEDSTTIFAEQFELLAKTNVSIFGASSKLIELCSENNGINDISRFIAQLAGLRHFGRSTDPEYRYNSGKMAGLKALNPGIDLSSPEVVFVLTNFVNKYRTAHDNTKNLFRNSEFLNTVSIIFGEGWAKKLEYSKIETQKLLFAYLAGYSYGLLKQAAATKYINQDRPFANANLTDMLTDSVVEGWLMLPPGQRNQNLNSLAISISELDYKENLDKSMIELLNRIYSLSLRKNNMLAIELYAEVNEIANLLANIVATYGPETPPIIISSLLILIDTYADRIEKIFIEKLKEDAINAIPVAAKEIVGAA